MFKLSNYEKQFFIKNKSNLIMTLFLIIMQVGFDLAIAFLLMSLIDIANSGTLAQLYRMCIVGTLVIVINCIISFIGRFFMQKFHYNALVNYKNFVLSKILNMDINSFNFNTTGKFISVLTNDVNSIELNYLETLIILFRQMLLLIGGLIAMIYLNITLFICCVVVAMLPFFVSILFGKKIDVYERSVSFKNEKFVALIKDIMSGFSVVKSFKAEQEVQKEYKSENEELEDTKKKKRYALTNVEILTNATSYFVVFVVFAFGTYLTLKGHITAGVVMAFIQLFNYVIQPLQQIPVLFSKIKASRALLMKVEETVHIEDTNEKTRVLDFNNHIEIKNVSFGYDESKKVLNNVSVKFEKNKSYAIVGASGSGKSTLLNLMLGFFSNYSGNILLDGKEVKNIQTTSLYDLFSVIQQNVFIFNNTIHNNITMFKNFNDKDVDKAIKLAGLQKIIDEKGTEYLCGEGGAKLSGGEKQRVAIARSLIKRTPILLMDEATAALDNTTTKAVEDAILELQNVTRILITHRLNENILRKIDSIIVMKNGKVIEEGTFEELLAKKMHFYSLYNLNSDESEDFDNTQTNAEVVKEAYIAIS